jgi:hypothetical protein
VKIFFRMAESNVTSTLLPLPPSGRVRPFDDDASTLAVLDAFGEGIFVFGETMLACLVRHAARGLTRDAELARAVEVATVDGATGATGVVAASSTARPELAAVAAASSTARLELAAVAAVAVEAAATMENLEAAAAPVAAAAAESAATAMAAFNAVESSPRKSALDARLGMAHEGVEFWNLNRGLTSQRLDAAAWQLLERVALVDDGLLFNTFTIGYGSADKFGVICHTCNNGSVTAIASGSYITAGTNPFNNFFKHVGGARHIKCRSALVCEVESLAGTGRIERAPAAMAVFAARTRGETFVLTERPTELQPIGSEPTGMRLRGCAVRSEPPLLRASVHQETLDRECGLGCFAVRPDGLFADCKRCRRDKIVHVSLTNRAWLRNATAHAATHINISGMRTLDMFGILPTSIALNATIRPAFEFDHSQLCHGFWLPSTQHGGVARDCSVLLFDLRRGHEWYPEPCFQARLVYECDGARSTLPPCGAKLTWLACDDLRAEGSVVGHERGVAIVAAPDAASLVLLRARGYLNDREVTLRVDVGDIASFTYNVAGTFRSSNCARHCLDSVGSKLPHLMCRGCAEVPLQRDFRERLARRVDSTAKTLARTRLDLVPDWPTLLERARQSAAKADHQKLLILEAKRKLGQSRAARRSLIERLEERALTGDLAGLAADLQYCQANDKLNGRAVMVSFITDIVKSWRLGAGSKGMRWHESSKRLFAVLTKFGGPRSVRLLRANVGGVGESTIARCWSANLYRYPLGEDESVVRHVVGLLKPLLPGLHLKPGEMLPCQVRVINNQKAISNTQIIYILVL